MTYRETHGFWKLYISEVNEIFDNFSKRHDLSQAIPII